MTRTTTRMAKNALVPLLVVLLGWWLRPTLNRLPAPELPQVELTSFDNETKPAGSCRLINDLNQPAVGMKFCEDLVQWPQADLIIVSCDPGRLRWNTVLGPLADPTPRGVLYAYHFNSTTSEDPSGTSLYRLDMLGFPDSQDFHPLGLELHSTNTHSARLFVVNHRRDRSVIEVFDLNLDSENQRGGKATLSWRRTLAHDRIWTPNSIVAVGPTSLLVTNDHYFNRRFHSIPHILETWLRIPGGNVIEIEFDDNTPGLHSSSSIGDALESKGVEAWKVIGRIHFANGLALDPSGTTLVVAASMEYSLFFYSRKPPTTPESRASYAFTGSKSLTFAPDNIVFDEPKRIIVTGHPHGLTLVKFVKAGGKATPPGSWVSIVTASDSSGPFEPSNAKVQTVFRDDGHFFSSSSTAVIIKKKVSESPDTPSKLFVSGLYQKGLMECAI